MLQKGEVRTELTETIYREMKEMSLRVKNTKAVDGVIQSIKLTRGVMLTKSSEHLFFIGI